MECPVVTKCCFCVPLRKGVLIFGYINLELLSYLRRFLQAIALVPVLARLDGLFNHLRQFLQAITLEPVLARLDELLYFMRQLLQPITLVPVLVRLHIMSLIGLPILIFLAVEGMTTEDLNKKFHLKGGKFLNLNLNITFTALEVVMTSILLFGVHKKKKNILKVYFYTGLVLCTLPFFIDVIFFNIALKSYFTYFITMGLNYYLLFLVYQLIYTAEEPAAGMQFTNHTPNTNSYV